MSILEIRSFDIIEDEVGIPSIERFNFYKTYPLKQLTEKAINCSQEEALRCSDIRRERRAMKRSIARYSDNYEDFLTQLKDRIETIRKEEPVNPLPVMAKIDTHHPRHVPKLSKVQIPPTQGKLYGYWVLHPEFNKIIPCVVGCHRKGDLIKKFKWNVYGYY